MIPHFLSFHFILERSDDIKSAVILIIDDDKSSLQGPDDRFYRNIGNFGDLIIHIYFKQFCTNMSKCSHLFLYRAMI